MDNYYGGGDKASHVVDRFQHLRKAMPVSSLEMGKIQCNSSSVLVHFLDKEKASSFREIENKNGVLPMAKALGVRWDCQDNSFRFSTRAASKPPPYTGRCSQSACLNLQPTAHHRPVPNGGKVTATEVSA